MRNFLRALLGRIAEFAGARAVETLRWGGAAAGLVIFSGCAWPITPPRQVREPVPVVLTEYSRHTRLALPQDTGPLAHARSDHGEPATGEKRFIEYGFGDWDYYGLQDHRHRSGLRAILGRGSGAFSRRLLTGRPPGFDFGGNRQAVFWVERDLVDALRERLEARWAGNPERVVRRGDNVPVSRDAQRYHLLHNSNAATAGWLKELGCDVKGHPILSNFRTLDHRNASPPGRAGLPFSAHE